MAVNVLTYEDCCEWQLKVFFLPLYIYITVGRHIEKQFVSLQIVHLFQIS